jgi:hypothetical protein
MKGTYIQEVRVGHCRVMYDRERVRYDANDPVSDCDCGLLIPSSCSFVYTLLLYIHPLSRAPWRARRGIIIIDSQGLYSRNQGNGKLA